jgi:16S rRNA (cytidine1402-2'-O)-methyltransferase
MSSFDSAEHRGKLFVVATPIGNLEDITLRALRVLKEVEYVACEDTRQTRKLLSHFEIRTPAVNIKQLGKLLAEGKQVALVSDAGTPGVSDPGLELVSLAREAGHAVEVVPGASALAAALSVAGLRAPTFTFYGFLPQKKGREKLLKAIAADERASVFYESPHRIMKTLAALAELLPPEQRLGIYRELTKMHEEQVVGSAQEVLAHFTMQEEKQRGEFVVIVESR